MQSSQRFKKSLAWMAMRFPHEKAARTKDPGVHQAIAPRIAVRPLIYGAEGVVAGRIEAATQAMIFQPEPNGERQRCYRLVLRFQNVLLEPAALRLQLEFDSGGVMPPNRRQPGHRFVHSEALQAIVPFQTTPMILPVKGQYRIAKCKLRFGDVSI